MNFVNAFTVNGQTYTLQDPNAVTHQQLEAKIEEIAQTVLEALSDAAEVTF